MQNTSVFARHHTKGEVRRVESSGKFDPPLKNSIRHGDLIKNLPASQLNERLWHWGQVFKPQTSSWWRVVCLDQKIIIWWWWSHWRYQCWCLSHETVTSGSVGDSGRLETTCFQCIPSSAVCKRMEASTSKSCRCVPQVCTHTLTYTHIGTGAFSHTSTALFNTSETWRVNQHTDAHSLTHRCGSACTLDFHPTVVLWLGCGVL